MKTRILKIERNDGRTFYYPQYRNYFFWFNFKFGMFTTTFLEEKEAKDFIDSKIQEEMQVKQNAYLNKAKKTEVIKYP